MCVALATAFLAGAPLSVFEVGDGPAPLRYPLPHPVHHLNLVLAPNHASGTIEARWQSLRIVGKNLWRMLVGESLANFVDIARAVRQPVVAGTRSTEDQRRVR